MNFGEKLKKLRSDNRITQEELAAKLFVTRTAVSKWETGRGMPDIENLKRIAELFRVGLDELLSVEELESRKLVEDKRARTCYFVAIGFLGLTLAFCIAAYITKNNFLSIGTVIFAIGYIVFGLFATPAYKREERKKNRTSYIISRAFILIFVVAMIVSTALNG